MMDGGGKLQVRLFGSFEAKIDINPIDLQRRRADKLLTLLILRHREEFDKKNLHDTLWSEHEGTIDTKYGPTDKSIHLLYKEIGHHYFSKQRKEKDWYWRINVEHVWADTVIVEEAISDGDTNKLEQARLLCRGPLLETWSGEEWARKEAELWMGNQLKSLYGRLNRMQESAIADALSRLAITLRQMQQVREIKIHWALLGCLNASRNECRKQDVPFRTPNLLLSLFDMSSRYAVKVFNEVKNGSGDDLPKRLRWHITNIQTPIDRETGQRYTPFEWSEQKYVQIAVEEAMRENCPVVMENHLLLGVLQSRSSNTVEWLRATLGEKDFAKLMMKLRSDRGTPPFTDSSASS